MSDTLEDLKAELRSLTVEQLAEVSGIEPWRIYQMLKKRRGATQLQSGEDVPISG